jgi:hypothetical protein
MGDLTSGIARVGIGRPFTIEHDSCAGGDGSPSDCPLLCVMPTRSTLRLSPAEQPTSMARSASSDSLRALAPRRL